MAEVEKPAPVAGEALVNDDLSTTAGPVCTRWLGLVYCHNQRSRERILVSGPILRSGPVVGATGLDRPAQPKFGTKVLRNRGPKSLSVQFCAGFCTVLCVSHVNSVRLP